MLFTGYRQSQVSSDRSTVYECRVGIFILKEMKQDEKPRRDLRDEWIMGCGFTGKVCQSILISDSSAGEDRDPSQNLSGSSP